MPCKRHVLTKGLTDEEEQLLENLSMVLVIRAVEDTTLRGLVKSRTEAMNAAPEGKIGHFTLTGEACSTLWIAVSRESDLPRVCYQSSCFIQVTRCTTWKSLSWSGPSPSAAPALLLPSPDSQSERNWKRSVETRLSD